MPTLFSTLRISSVRSLLLISVLVTLCISEGVGLQLLPIPIEAHTGVEQSPQGKIRTDVPGPLPQRKSISCRVEIIVPKLKGLPHQQSIQVIASPLPAARPFTIRLSAPVYSPEPVSDYSFTFVPQGASRSPPLPA